MMTVRGRAAEGDVQLTASQLVACYQRIDHDRMRDLPLRNDALVVEAVGFCHWQGLQLGVMISPWFINLVLVAGAQTDWSSYRPGHKVEYGFPAGCYDFVHSELERFGPIQTCSLMSPVVDIQDQDTARAIAEDVMRLLFEAPQSVELQDAIPKASLYDDSGDNSQSKPKSEVQSPMTRRELLRGRRNVDQ
ncbi:MAG: [NiFe]-hydrogenase assembly chaperone HybE [Magnetovibrio sp.]|nr:[NiFe]-hydrogenase assembly chaperone HybE [Magnetovibrio sp.]